VDFLKNSPVLKQYNLFKATLQLFGIKYKGAGSEVFQS
jgi:hypothetical protein